MKSIIDIFRRVAFIKAGALLPLLILTSSPINSAGSISVGGISVEKDAQCRSGKGVRITVSNLRVSGMRGRKVQFEMRLAQNGTYLRSTRLSRTVTSKFDRTRWKRRRYCYRYSTLKRVGKEDKRYYGVFAVKNSSGRVLKRFKSKSFSLAAGGGGVCWSGQALPRVRGNKTFLEIRGYKKIAANRNFYYKSYRRHDIGILFGPRGRWRACKRLKNGKFKFLADEFRIDKHGTHRRKFGTNSFFNSHHVIQDAWAKANLPLDKVKGYDYNSAIAVLLVDRGSEPKGVRRGSPHDIINKRQQASKRKQPLNKRTYAQERKLARQDLNLLARKYSMPYNPDLIMKKLDKYFCRIKKNYPNRSKVKAAFKGFKCPGDKQGGGGKFIADNPILRLEMTNTKRISPNMKWLRSVGASSVEYQRGVVIGSGTIRFKNHTQARITCDKLIIVREFKKNGNDVRWPENQVRVIKSNGRCSSPSILQFQRDLQLHDVRSFDMRFDTADPARMRYVLFHSLRARLRFLTTQGGCSVKFHQGYKNPLPITTLQIEKGRKFKFKTQGYTLVLDGRFWWLPRSFTVNEKTARVDKGTRGFGTVSWNWKGDSYAIYPSFRASYATELKNLGCRVER